MILGKSPTALLNFLISESMCVYHWRFSCIKTPRYFTVDDVFIFFTVNSEIEVFGD